MLHESKTWLAKEDAIKVERNDSRPNDSIYAM